MHGQQLCRRLEVQPGSLLRIRLFWLLCVRNRQALLVVEPLLLLLLVLEAVPMKPPPLDPRIGLLLELFKNNGFSRKTLFLYHYQP